MDRWQYLIVLGACLLITAPLEFFGKGVYRQPRRLAAAVLPVAAHLRGHQHDAGGSSPQVLGGETPVNEFGYTHPAARAVIAVSAIPNGPLRRRHRLVEQS